MLTPLQVKLLWDQVRTWQDKGVIEQIPLHEFSLNPVFVPKKTGAIRVCIDATPTNEVTRDWDYPLPDLKTLRYRLTGFKWFARLDLTDAFFRISVRPQDRVWTSFRCMGRQYAFRRMPFGLKTAPSTFQRYMDNTLIEYVATAYWFIDDILIGGYTLEDLREKVRRIKSKLLKAGSQVNENKSEYDKQCIQFCGIMISSEGIGPDQAKVQEILNTPIPTTKKDAQSALGLVSYLRDFIPLTSHFTSMLYPDKDGLKLPYTQYVTQWKKLLGHLASAATSLRHFNPKEPCTLYTDASGGGLGAIVIQNKKVVALASRQLTGAETRYSATDRETIGLVFAAKKFKMMLHSKSGANEVFNDHAAIMTRKRDDLSPKQERWLHIIQYWMPKLKHVKGLDNPADFISRWKWEIGGGAMNI